MMTLAFQPFQIGHPNCRWTKSATIGDPNNGNSDGSLRLTATVLNSQALKWWLLGFGDQVEVLGPEPLRAWFAEVANNLAARYR